VKLDQSFEVNAPMQAVWEALVDVERVAPCLPGAEITEGGDDGQYKGTFTVKLGPTTAAYRGTLHMESVDEASHTAVMRANGTDKRGQGGAKAQITSVVTEGEGGATKVDVSTDFTITGRLARFGRGGMIQDVSNRLLREFAECLQRNLEPEDGPAVTAEAAPGEPAPFAPAGGEQKPPAFAPAGGGKPVSGLRLFFGALVDRLRRVLQRRRST
jgi:carbon monoxide dehydrogenase subunit G